MALQVGSALASVQCDAEGAGAAAKPAILVAVAPSPRAGERSAPPDLLHDVPVWGMRMGNVGHEGRKHRTKNNRGLANGVGGRRSCASPTAKISRTWLFLATDQGAVGGSAA